MSEAAALKVEEMTDPAAWDLFVRTSDGASHYHLSGWKRVLEQSYGNPTVYLAASSPEGIRGILPLARVRGFFLSPHLASLPYLSWAGVCADDPAAAVALVREAGDRGTRSGARYVELHNTRGFDGPSGSEAGHRLATVPGKLAMALTLDADPDVIWKGFKAKVRNQVKKAMKSGLTVAAGGAEKLDAFYEVYAENMRDLGSPVHGRRFFTAILREFPSDIRLFTIHKGADLAGAAFLLRFKNGVEVPWASSKRRYLRDCPNNLLYWEMIRYACLEGIQAFDFGRSTEDSGTYRFKKQWGSVPRPLYWQYYLPDSVDPPDPSHAGWKAKLMVSAWKRLPLGLANLLGPRIRGHISA